MLKSYDDMQCRTFRKVELGHHVPMLEFIYLEGEDMLMHKVKTTISILCWGPLSLVRLFCLKEQLDHQVSPICRMVLEHQGPLCGIHGDSVTQRFMFQVFA